MEPSVINLISGDLCTWEQEPLKSLVSEGELMSYNHNGFWQPMDTLRDKIKLDKLIELNKAPWIVW